MAGETQLLVTGNVKCLQTQSAVQAMLSGLIRRVESPGLVLPGVEMVPPGIHRSVAGPGIRSSPRPGCSEGDAGAPNRKGELADMPNEIVIRQWPTLSQRPAAWPMTREALMRYERLAL